MRESTGSDHDKGAYLLIVLNTNFNFKSELLHCATHTCACASTLIYTDATLFCVHASQEFELMNVIQAHIRMISRYILNVIQTKAVHLTNTFTTPQRQGEGLFCKKGDPSSADRKSIGKRATNCVKISRTFLFIVLAKATKLRI